MEKLEARLGEMMAEVKSMRMKMEELKRSIDEQEVAAIENKKKHKKQKKKMEKMEARLREMLAEVESMRMKMEEMERSIEEQEVAVIGNKKKQKMKIEKMEARIGEMMSEEKSIRLKLEELKRKHPKKEVEGPITPDKEESQTNISAKSRKRNHSSDDAQPSPKRAKSRNFNPLDLNRSRFLTFSNPSVAIDRHPTP